MSGSRDEEAQLEDTIRASASEISTDPFERSSALSPGIEIGRYRLGARLGAGAMGEVWSATDPQLERQVAIKLVHPRLARDPEVSARLLREARAMAKVSHRAVIAVHDAGETDGRLFLAMELVRGRTLGAMLSARSPSERADWRRWLALMIEAGRGLAAAHAAGVLHRDFKPDNILVDHANRICVGDFGLASLAGAPRSRVSQPVIANPTELDLTITGALLGTPAYMSLEQLRGEEVDARSDQFSFCVATYEALYGERPYAVPESERGNIAVLLDTVAAGHVREPADPNTVPPAIRAILLRGLAATRGERWPDLGALLAALAKAGAPPTSRRPYLAIGIAIAAVVVALGIALHSQRHAVLFSTATRVEPLPFNATIARSPGGRFATAADRVDITDPTTGKTSTWPTPGGWIDAVQFEDEETVRWADRSQPGKVWRWHYASADPELTSRGDGHWLGAVREGEVIEKFGVSGPNEIDLDRGGVTVMRWPHANSKVELSTVAPAGHRLAYLSTERFNGHIVVIDASTFQTWRSPDIVEPTGLGWRTDDRLLYGTADGWIHELPIDASGFGTVRDVYRLEKGWAGRILAGSPLELVVHTPASHVRVIEREPASVRDFEPSVAAVEVGFTTDGRFLVWNPRTRHLERRTETQIGDTLEAQLDAEPANATCAGDLLIAAERGIGGRTLVAVSLSTGKRLWQHPVGTSLLARCANDRSAPCFVARRIADPDERYEVLSLDPQTGIASGAPVYRGALEDMAVRADGQRILIGNGTQEIREIDLHGTVTAKPEPTMSSVRSIAYDKDGSVLYGGTIIGGSYAVGRFANGEFSVLSRSDGVLLSMVRPSPTSAQILSIGRSVSSDLFELRPP